MNWRRLKPRREPDEFFMAVFLSTADQIQLPASGGGSIGICNAVYKHTDTMIAENCNRKFWGNALFVKRETPMILHHCSGNHLAVALNFHPLCGCERCHPHFGTC